MRSLLVQVSLFASAAVGWPGPLLGRSLVHRTNAAPSTTVHLCGDSTMARMSGSSNTQGWGEYLRYSFDPAVVAVSNRAIGGRSARSFTREGRFDEVARQVKAGDWVVIEFGHNDGGSLSRDNGRSDCFGEGNETCETTYNGVRETVYTYGAYLKNASTVFLAKGAKVILSSPTPNNVWEGGRYSWAPGRFDYYAWLAVSQLGGPARGAYFVPHGAYAAQAMRNMGREAVNANYPNDHTHTAPLLADVMSRSFVLGLKCGTSQLAGLVVNSTESLTASSGILGGCIAHNSTLPVRALEGLM